MIRAAFRENQDVEVTRTLPQSRFSFSRLDRELHDALPDLRSVEFSLPDIVSELSFCPCCARSPCGLARAYERFSGDQNSFLDERPSRPDAGRGVPRLVRALGGMGGVSRSGRPIP